MTMIYGADAFFDLAADLRRASSKGLQKELYAGLNRAVKPIKKSIVTEVGKVMPAGYAPVLTRSLRIRASRAGGLRIRLVVSAKGKRENRDVPRLDQGQLRHPVYGRTRIVKGRRRPNPWATTRIRAGFVTRPFDDSLPAVVREIGAVVDRVAAQIAKG